MSLKKSLLIFILLLSSALSSSWAQNMFYHLLPQNSLAPFTWTGLAGDNNWTNTGNWSTNAVPGASDTAKFYGGACSGAACNVTMNTNVTVKGIDINSSFTGTLTQPTTNTISVGTSNWVQAGGTFVGGDSSINVDGTFTLTAGSFTSTSATFTVKNTYSISGSPTFNHNNGTVKFQAPVGYGQSVTPGAVTYKNVNLVYNAAGYTTQITLNNGTLSVSGTLTVSGATGAAYNDLRNGTVDVKGDIILTGNGVGFRTNSGSAQFILSGNSDQKIDASGTGLGYLESLRIASTGGTVSLLGTIGIKGNYTLNSGNLNAGTSTLYFYDETGGHTHNPGTANYNNVIFTDTNIGYNVNNSFGGSTFNILGDLLLDSCNTGGCFDVNLNNGTFKVGGNLNISRNGAKGTVLIEMNGNASKTLAGATASKIPSGHITINKTTYNNTVTLTGAFSATNTGQNLTVNVGTFDMAGYNLSVNGTLTVNAGSTLICNGGTLTAGSVVNNGTILCPGYGNIWTGLAGGNTWNTPGNWSNNSVPIASEIVYFMGSKCSGGNCNVTVNTNAVGKGVVIDNAYGGTITQGVGNTITIGTTGWTQPAGTFVGNSANISIDGNFDFSGGTFTSTVGTLTLKKNVNIAGTFNNGAGTVVLAPSGNVNLDFIMTTFHHLTFTPTAMALFDGSGTATVNGNTTINIMTLFNTGLTFDCYGNITTHADSLNIVGPTTTKFYVKGNASGQTVDGGGLPGLVVDAGGLSVTLGYLQSFNYTEIISGNITANNEISLGGVFAGLHLASFYDLKIFGYPGDSNDLAGQSIAVSNNLTFEACTGVSINNGTFQVQGGLILSTDACGGDFVVDVIGASSMIYAWFGTGSISNLKITAPAAVAINNSDIVIDNLQVDAGSFFMNGYNVTVNNSISLAGTTITKNSGTLTLMGSPVGTGLLFGGIVDP